MHCRHCHTSLTHCVIDLGYAPPSNAYLSADALMRPEIHYPLRVMVCDACWLVQTEDYAHHAHLFDGEYAYFSSTSTTWLAHTVDYVDMIVPRLQLGARSYVVELAANDGYLLQYMVARNIPCMGVEPTHSTAQAARNKGIRIEQDFFGEALARVICARDGHADLMIANNVLAHVPDINDFLCGVAILLAPQGTITIEFPHLLNLVRQDQFDTIYHEHFSYLSLQVVDRIMRTCGLCVYDVEALPTHGGSLRLYAGHIAAGHVIRPAVADIVQQEQSYALESLACFRDFQARAKQIKTGLLAFLLAQQCLGKKVLGYGAAAKGSTLLNYAGVDADLLPMVADAAHAKQGKFLPGSHIPIVSPDVLLSHKPDYVVILPWNLKEEVTTQLAAIRQWGGQFVIAVPDIQVW